MDINLTKDCIKEAQNWGSTTYFNICTNESSKVPWGFMDFLGWILLLAFLFGAISLLVFIIKDYSK